MLIKNGLEQNPRLVSLFNYLKVEIGYFYKITSDIDETNYGNKIDGYINGSIIGKYIKLPIYRSKNGNDQKKIKALML